MESEAYSCERVVPIEEEPRHHLVIANEFVRAFAVEIGPHERTLCHHHPHDYLLYVASGAEIISAAPGEEPKRLSYSDGECELASAGLTHVVENLGDTAFRNIVLEPLHRSRELRRGLQPRLVRGNARVDCVLDTDPGAVFLLQVEPDAEVEVFGPAVLATAYDEPLMLKELDDYDIPLDEFQKLMWICAPRQVWLRNSGRTPAHLVVLQIGSTGR